MRLIRTNKAISQSMKEKASRDNVVNLKLKVKRRI